MQEINSKILETLLTKICKRCNKELDYSNFSRNKNFKDDYSSYCKKCNSKYYQENKELYQEHIKEHKKEYWRRNKKQIQERRREYNKKYRKINKEKNQEYLKNYRLIVKKRILEHYGVKCTCCGETRIEFLTIDHINGGGNKHRKEIGGGSKIYNWLIKNNFPEGFQVLCFNCNCAKSFSGYCPHKKI